MNRRLRNAIAGRITAPRVAVMVTLVSVSLAMGTATAHAAVEPSPVSPSPTKIYAPNSADLVITSITGPVHTMVQVTIKNNGPVASAAFRTWVEPGERQATPRLCTEWAEVPGYLHSYGYAYPNNGKYGLGPYQSLTLQFPWTSNQRKVWVDIEGSSQESNETNNTGIIPASDDLRPNQCVLSQ